jgi:hypothetical protein
MVKLSLKDNNLGTKEAGEDIGDLLKTNSVLEALNLSENCIAYWEGGDVPRFAKEVALGIMGNQTLKALDFSNNLVNADSEDMHFLSDAIGSSNITALNVAGNFLDKNNGAEDIAEMITKGSLTALNIGSNGLYGKSALVVANAVKVMELRSFVCYIA